MSDQTMIYDPSDWYWSVPGESGFYSSRYRSFVAANDPELRAFEDRGNTPTPIADIQELKRVLREQCPEGLPHDLPAHAANQRWRLEVGGINVNGMPVDTSRESQALIHGAFSLAQISSEARFRFKAGDQFLSLNAAQIIAIGQAVAEHVQACFAWEAAVLEAISAGEISSEAEVELAAQNFLSE